LGRHSYEVYLTHMFVVLWLIQTFRALGAPMRWGLSWYGMILALSGLLGAATARGYSEPMNRWIRRRWSGGFHPPAVPAER
jgi:peptidoglycan/LPS O-acetylase OafA/YrhL